VRLRLESQGEFVALISAIQMQLESDQPIEKVVRLLADALLALAEARGVDAERIRLAERVGTLVDRVRSHSGSGERR
jgi:hypothetical protein